MKNKGLIIIILSFVFLVNIQERSFAQNAIFLMNSVDMMPGITITAPAVNFKSISSCVNITTGIDVFIGKHGKGEFDVNCQIAFKINSLGIKLYPNPISDNSKVRILIMPPTSEFFTLTIWTTEGQLVETRKESGYNLYQGVPLGVKNIQSGSYVVKIQSVSFIDVIKFVKAN